MNNLFGAAFIPPHAVAKILSLPASGRHLEDIKKKIRETLGRDLTQEELRFFRLSAVAFSTDAPEVPPFKEKRKLKRA